MKYYHALLHEALQLIDLYVAEIRNRPDLVQEGFCQGEIFQEAAKKLGNGVFAAECLENGYLE